MSIVEKVKAIATKQVENTEFSLYDVEYVKEGSEYFLRIYFDKDGGLTLDDCVLLSEKLAEELDKEDFISDKYYLEVSSPGIERELRDLEALYEKHKAAGYDVTDLKGLPGFPPSYYFIKDPDGYKIEVIRTKM